MEFNALLLMDFKGGFVVKCSSNYTVIFHSGMSVTVEKVEDLLQLFLLVPPNFKGVVYCFICLNDFISYWLTHRFDSLLIVFFLTEFREHEWPSRILGRKYRTRIPPSQRHIP